MCFGGRTVKDVLVLPQKYLPNAKRDIIWKRGRPLIHEAFFLQCIKIDNSKGLQ